MTRDDYDTRFSSAGRFVRVAFIAFNALVLSAVVIQDLTGVAPMGLFNAGRGVYAAAAVTCLVAASAALLVQVVEFAGGKWSRAAAVVRGVIVSALVLELLVTATDLLWMSRSAGAPLGGPYYETTSRAGAPLILRKHAGGSPFGFRTEAPYEKETAAYRVLFLGDSYTEGSGRHAECNYPTVVESTLGRAMGRAVEVMNAGVSGYGPIQARALLTELVARGYRFDAVVYNFLTENDFTDSLPGTDRRVVAGMAFRFPRSRFLRLFHPLNSRTFRSAMFVRGLIRVRYELHDVTAIGTGPCRLDGERLESLPDGLDEVVTRRIADATRVLASPGARRDALDALDAMRRIARSLGVPFVVVVFPDRALVDPDLRRLLGEKTRSLGDVAALVDVVSGGVGTVPVLDVTDALAGRAGAYRRADTHLSDLGNVIAGEWVAGRLAEALR